MQYVKIVLLLAVGSAIAGAGIALTTAFTGDN